MSESTLAEENLLQDTRKKWLECRALERSAKFEVIKTAATVLGAAGILIGFGFDRYKVSEQRDQDRRVAISREYDALLSKTLTALNEARPTTVMFRANVESFRERVIELEEAAAQFGSIPGSRGILEFARESRGLSDHILASIPEKFEFSAWTTAIEAEAIWSSHASGFAPDFEILFGEHAAREWPSVRESALKALRTRFSLTHATDVQSVEAFRDVAFAFQREILLKNTGRD